MFWEMEDAKEAFLEAGCDQVPSSCSIDSLFDEILRETRACTHTHLCNPPGPDLAHTHTCLHVHTKVLSETGESSGKKHPHGNREAVRRYRKKKKARAASLEEENRDLRAQNQHLMRKIRNATPLEAENMRLKCLLVDLRGRIDGEIGCFPYQKPLKNSINFIDVVVQGEDQADNVLPSGGR